MHASASNFARRCSLRQWQGRTPLSTTNSHPVPEQDEQVASCLVLSHCSPSRDESDAVSFATAYREFFFASSLDIFFTPSDSFGEREIRPAREPLAHLPPGYIRLLRHSSRPESLQWPGLVLRASKRKSRPLL